MVFARRINVLYLAFDSHHPAQHKRSVVSTLMRRANTIPSSEALRTEETSHVQDSLQVNGYPTKFIENAAQPRSGPQNHHPDPAGLAVVPYVQGMSWTWDVSSVLRASLEGMVFMRRIKIQSSDFEF